MLYNANFRNKNPLNGMQHLNIPDFEIIAGELIKYRGLSENITIPDTVKIINSGAFDNLYIESLVIPDSVTTICRFAFSQCAISKIIIPKSISNIEDGAFAGCISLKSIKVDENNAHYSSYNNILYNKNKTTLIYCPKDICNFTIPTSVNTIGAYAFDGCENLTNISIPISVKSIGNQAFSWCRNLTNISIPNSVTDIGEEAFMGCESLKSIILPNGIQTIPFGLFKKCTRLTSVEIPFSVTSIAYQAFRECPRLKDIEIPNTVRPLYTESFDSWTTIHYKKNGCYIATCVYGSYDCPQVWTLRRYRDNILAKTWYGRAFIHTYYTISPTIVNLFGKKEWFKKMWKWKLDRMVVILLSKGVKNTPYNDENW